MRAFLVMLLLTLAAACSHGANGTVEGIAYELPLDGAYRMADLPRWHEQIWYSDDADAPIVSVHVSPVSRTEGEAPRCVTSGGLLTGEGFVFYPDALDRPRDGKSAGRSWCSPSHPDLKVMCSVYFRDGEMDRTRAEASVAPCRGMRVH